LYLSLLIGPVAAASGPDDGIPTERTWSMLWVWLISAPVVTVIIVPLGLVLDGVDRLWGPLVVVLATLGTVIAELLLIFGVLNGLRPKRIRLDRAGVHIERMFGAARVVPWESLSVSAARPQGFGLLRFTKPVPGMVMLSPRQYEAVNSSAYRSTPDSKPLLQP
jgi:hypothetical protein